MTPAEFESGVNNILDSTKPKGVDGSKGITKAIFKQIVVFFKNLLTATITAKDAALSAQSSTEALLEEIKFASNAYKDSSNNWRYIVSGYASRYYQINGIHIWEKASGGAADAIITWTESLRITPDGRVLIGSSVNPELFSVYDSGYGDYFSVRKGLIGGNETSIKLTYNYAGNIIYTKVLVGPPDSAGTGFRYLRIVN